ncbi:MAG: tetratricopeptide repeat protein, partial [Lysobacterales bacterium]
LYQQAVAADPQFAAAHAALGRVEWVLSAGVGSTNPEALDALVLPHLDRALELDPAQSDAYLTKGSLLRGSFRPGGDVFYRLAVEVGPNNAQAHHNLGIWENQLGHYDKALELLRQAVELDPMIFWSHESLFGVLVTLGQGEVLPAVASRAMTLFPDEPGAAALGCAVHRWLGDVDQTLACLLKAMQQFPTSSEVIWPAVEDCGMLGLDSCKVALLEPMASAGDVDAELELARIRNDLVAMQRILSSQRDVFGYQAGQLGIVALDAGLWDEARRFIDASGIELAQSDDGQVHSGSIDKLNVLIQVDRHEGLVQDAGRHLDLLLNWTAAREQNGARSWQNVLERADVLALAGLSEEALAEFERATSAFGLPANKDYLDYLDRAPQFDSLRSDPRFTAFIATNQQLQAKLRERLPATLAQAGV